MTTRAERCDAHVREIRAALERCRKIVRELRPPPPPPKEDDNG